MRINCSLKCNISKARELKFTFTLQNYFRYDQLEYDYLNNLSDRLITFLPCPHSFCRFNEIRTI